MKTYLWSKIIELAYNFKTMKLMYMDYMHNLTEDTFLNKYLSINNLIKNNSDYLNFIKIKSKYGFDILTIFDENYPEKLRNSIHPPIAFYYIGDINLINRKAISVVGSRIAPIRYLRKSENLGKGLNNLKLIGVSGLAKGVDAYFHAGCHNSIGVLGCGIDIIYPYNNKMLYSKVAQQGCLISEYPIGTKPLPWHFPRRNRIIASLGDILIIIYANEKSGSLITLDFALDLGKDIFLTNAMYERFDIPGYRISDFKKCAIILR